MDPSALFEASEGDQIEIDKFAAVVMEIAVSC